MISSHSVPAAPPELVPAHRRIKVVSLGDAGVGKSCVIKRYCEGRFVSEYITTIGIDYGVKLCTLPSPLPALPQPVSPKSDGGEPGASKSTTNHPTTSKVHVNFWDMAGEEVYVQVRNEFYDNVDGLLLVFDVQDRRSLDHVRDRWLKEVAQLQPLSPTVDSLLANCCAVLVGNKTDLPAEERQVSTMEAERVALELGIPYFETSAKTGFQIDEAFTNLLQRVVLAKQQPLPSVPA